MSDKVVTDMVFRVEILRFGKLVDSEIVYVLASNDVIARSVAIEINNIELGSSWKCLPEEVEERSPITLCDVRRVKSFVVKSLV